MAVFGEWTSIEKAAPEEYQDVLVTDGYTVWLDNCSYPEHGARIDWNVEPDAYITHWMPLPAPVNPPAEYTRRYEVILASTWMDKINVVVECDSIYSCVVKGSQLCDMVNKMGSQKYEIAEITLLEDE